MTNDSMASRPPIHMIDAEADLLSDLALSAAERQPRISELLLEEISRARLHQPDSIDRGVVTLGALIDFVDEATGRGGIVELVLPSQADISRGRISILTPIGSGLIGLSEGQSIVWPVQEGEQHRLTVVKVAQPDRVN